MTEEWAALVVVRVVVVSAVTAEAIVEIMATSVVVMILVVAVENGITAAEVDQPVEAVEVVEALVPPDMVAVDPSGLVVHPKETPIKNQLQVCTFITVHTLKKNFMTQQIVFVAVMVL